MEGSTAMEGPTPLDCPGPRSRDRPRLGVRSAARLGRTRSGLRWQTDALFAQPRVNG